jgi:hypothetical protein
MSEMAKAKWRDLPRMNYMHLHAARMQAHCAVQWLARAARAYVPARPHDGHTNLGWDDGFGGLVTHALSDGSRVALRVTDLTLAVLGDAPAELPFDGRAEPEVRAWLGAKLARRGLNATKLDSPSPYATPWHVIAIGARYSLDELNEAFATHANWFANAHAALAVVQKHLAARRLKAPVVRLWPHHFDFDTLVDLGRGRTMGIGYCPGDEYCDEPYFYTSMWPEPPIPKLPLLPQPGHWHTYKFLAALAPAHKVLAAHDQGDYVRQFLDASIAAALGAMRGR